MAHPPNSMPLGWSRIRQAADRDRQFQPLPDLFSLDQPHLKGVFGSFPADCDTLYLAERTAWGTTLVYPVDLQWMKENESWREDLKEIMNKGHGR